MKVTPIAVVSEAPPTEPVQRVIKVRRDYNAWVAHESMEDYALRFTARSFRKWSLARVANTAFGGASSFLVLEAVGATLLVQHGFVNAALAILATGLIIFLAGLPISVYAARYGVDMDLLSRGAGFGYIGSTVTSLIYASFTFIFFALEAAVMAYALDLAFDIPPSWGYLICALLVIPLVTHGVTMISRLQVWTQPLWAVLLVLPYAFVFHENPGLWGELAQYGGEHGVYGFNWLDFGTAMTLGIALITQMGEQADYLRFMPERTAANRRRWWLATLVGGPGWVIPGVLKMLGGALLAYLAISHMVPTERAVDPNQMYLAAYEYVFPRYGWAVAATALFVLVSQLKINVTNAYAGSLAWSNFFSRVAHSHPGRVVWVLFNTLIALMLMELDVFQAMGGVLGLYSNVAISWMMAVVADLVVNKPLGLSPPGIEFKRAHLFDINPVGVGAMGLASLLSVSAHLGLFGPYAQAYSALIALVTAFAAAPLIAWATGGRYYIARRPRLGYETGLPSPQDSEPGAEQGQGQGTYGLKRCCICERDYERDDMAHCPAYQGPICSLCCTLDVRCNDLCKPEARLSAQWSAALRQLLPIRAWPYLDKGLGHYLLLMLLVVPLLGLVFLVLYHQELRQLASRGVGGATVSLLAPMLRLGYLKAYAALLVVAGVSVWWLVLAHKSRLVAQEEANRQTLALHEQARALRIEIESHRRTDGQLQEAKQQAESAWHQAERAKQLAESANQAKSRYITTISHELRTPLNSILGYAQLLEDDPAIPPQRRNAVSVIRRGGDHLLSLIEGTLDLARIEGGKLALEVRPMRLREGVAELVRLFELQAAERGIGFGFQMQGSLPEWVRADEKRVRQILINLLGNAVKFTRQGQVVLHASYAREMARFDIEDSGPGMSPAEVERVFEPFMRGSAAGGAAGGTGLGLTIAKMLTELMGGEMSVQSTPGQGSRFSVRLFLPELRGEPGGQVPHGARPRPAYTGYRGPQRRVLVVDNEEADRRFLIDALEPLGFELQQVASGEACLAWLAGLPAAEWPDAIFMDLAMPGIDGWETLRRLPPGPPGRAPALAIVSANAFDKGLDNDLGIAPEDFHVKPVRLGDLLHWLGQRLALDWVLAGADARPAGRVDAALPDSSDAADARPAAGTGDALHKSPAAILYPPAEALQSLADLLRVGYVRGVVARLDQIETEHPQCRPFVTQARALAQQFRLDALNDLLNNPLRTGLDGPQLTTMSLTDVLPEDAAPDAPPALREIDRASADIVLIVDDVPDNLALLHDALDEAGYAVLVATSGEQALGVVGEVPPDIVLLDAVMPGMDGFEVARRLKADPRSAPIPIVFMTGLTETEHVVAAFAVGGVDYVTKPIRPREVMVRISAHLRTARAQRQARNALDAFGHATLAVRLQDGRLVWQTALARRLLKDYFDTNDQVHSSRAPTDLLAWLQREVSRVEALGEARYEPAPLTVARGARRLTFALHEATGDGEWLIVLREADDAAVVEALIHTFKLTAREAEVLYWLVQGKTNRDIADILGASPATVKKHLEHVYAKLGVETRTAAANLAMQRVSQFGGNAGR